jgi:glucose dehydrogenase
MKKIYGFSVPCFVVLCSCLLAAQVPHAVTTYQYNNNHSGANTSESILTPTNVNVSQFGRKTVFPVQGYVYAQPLYVPNLTIGEYVARCAVRGNRARSGLCLRRG